MHCIHPRKNSICISHPIRPSPSSVHPNYSYDDQSLDGEFKWIPYFVMMIWLFWSIVICCQQLKRFIINLLLQTKYWTDRYGHDYVSEKGVFCERKTFAIEIHIWLQCQQIDMCTLCLTAKIGSQIWISLLTEISTIRHSLPKVVYRSPER